MYAGAAVSAVSLLTSLAYTGRVVVKLPHLADAAVPEVKDVRGVLVPHRV